MSEMSLTERSQKAVRIARANSEGDSNDEVMGYLSMHVAVLEDLILNSMVNLSPQEQEGVKRYLLTEREE